MVYEKDNSNPKVNVSDRNIYFFFAKGHSLSFQRFINFYLL